MHRPLVGPPLFRRRPLHIRLERNRHLLEGGPHGASRAGGDEALSWSYGTVRELIHLMPYLDVPFNWPATPHGDTSAHASAHRAPTYLQGDVGAVSRFVRQAVKRWRARLCFTGPTGIASLGAASLGSRINLGPASQSIQLNAKLIHLGYGPPRPCRSAQCVLHCTHAGPHNVCSITGSEMMPWWGRGDFPSPPRIDRLSRSVTRVSRSPTRVSRSTGPKPER